MTTKTLGILSPYVISDTDLFLDVAPGERKYILKVRDMPEQSKPREKLMAQGPSTLSIHELLAVILITGTPKEDVLELSGRILREYGEKVIIAEHDAEKLSADLDIPLVKARGVREQLARGDWLWKSVGHERASEHRVDVDVEIELSTRPEIGRGQGREELARRRHAHDRAARVHWRV